MSLKTPWYHGWNIVAISVVLQMAALGVMANCFSFFLDGWSSEFRVPISTLVFSITLFSVHTSLLAPVVGWAVERWSVRRIMLIGLLGLTLDYVLVGLATESWMILAIYGLLLPPAVMATSGVPPQTLVSRWFVRRRGLAFSICAVGLVLAGVVYPPIVVHLIAAFGWRATWWIFAGFHLVTVGTLVVLFLRDRPGAEEGRDYLSGEDHHALAATGSTISLREIVSRRNFWLVVAAFVPAMLAQAALNNNFAPYVHQRGLGLETAATLLAVFNVAAALGKLGAGAMADRYGNRLPLLVMTGSAGIGTFLLAFAAGAVPIGLGVTLLGAGQGMWVMLAACIATEFGSRDFARAFGFASATSVVTTLSAPAVAMAAERTGGYTGALAVTGLVCLGGIGAALFYRDSGKKVIGPEDEAELTLLNRA